MLRKLKKSPLVNSCTYRAKPTDLYQKFTRIPRSLFLLKTVPGPLCINHERNGKRCIPPPEAYTTRVLAVKQPFTFDGRIL